MTREDSPTKLRAKRDFAEALRIFKERYAESLHEGDRFLSGIYMDEIVQTSLMQAEATNKHWGVEDLKRFLRELRSRLDIPPDKSEDYDEDVEISIRKRFPEIYGIEKGEPKK